ncbi:helix-turn-helix transcriptional regulator [Streptomyces sp. RFCAC02]|uniref:helix-turn-helix transcriptional regulator n=1 Tax=Streptomyces sp. RFCAC02 TaxID=2499143 RepID=UPI001021915D|nr:helix-turn-helix transcriptional regulator [Streptomyces sp. RFCAC02]
MDQHAMAVLGLSDTEEAAYRHFLRNPRTPPADLHVLLRCDRRTADLALTRLRRLRLLLGDDAAVWAADPEVAVPRLAEERLDELHGQMRRLTRYRPIIRSLAGDRPPAAPDGGAAADGVERIEDLRQVRNRIDDLAFFAHDEVLSAEPYDALSPENIAHARALDMRCLRRGVRIRNIVRTAALGDPPTLAYLTELRAAGARVRAADAFSELILVYDRRTALVPIDPRDTSRGALCARESGLVGNIVTLFERLWEAADDLDTLVAPGAGPEPELTRTQRLVLSRMCAVSKDESGARQIGVSLRTYRRHIADLLQLLGADNRAQAALLARERGWI